jgi:6-phosphogluconolactonase (cycloisomerase 2 family)
VSQRVFAAGSYTDDRWGAPGLGLSLVTLDLDGRLRQTSSMLAIPNVSFIVGDGERLYCTSESEDGGITAVRVDADLRLELLESAPSGGALPCHLTWAEGTLIVSHYMSGDLQGFDVSRPLSSGAVWTRVERGSGPDLVRQAASHVHSTLIWGDRVVSANLGTDCVSIYRRDSLDDRGRPVLEARVRLPAGTGPRHMACHDDRLYVVGELDSRVHVIEAVVDGYLLSGSAPTTGGRGASYPSHIDVHPTRDLLMVANRGVDSFSVLDIGTGADDPLLVAEVGLHGAQPRHFSVSSDAVLIANEASSTLEVVGIASTDVTDWSTVDSAEMPSPTCVFEICP